MRPCLCKCFDRIEIQGSVWVRLMPDGTEPIGGVEWTDASPAQCRACGWVGTAGAALDDDAERRAPCFHPTLL